MTEFFVSHDDAGRWFAARNADPKFILEGGSEEDACDLGVRALRYYASRSGAIIATPPPAPTAPEPAPAS